MEKKKEEGAKADGAPKKEQGSGQGKKEDKGIVESLMESENISEAEAKEMAGNILGKQDGEEDSEEDGDSPSLTRWLRERMWIWVMSAQVGGREIREREGERERGEAYLKLARKELPNSFKNHQRGRLELGELQKKILSLVRVSLTTAQQTSTSSFRKEREVSHGAPTSTTFRLRGP